MSFTPKFADLIRNFTTVQGTGPVTLGQAVSGYAGIADALSAGDQFYYCIQSVDKPQEREVGRGTLQADGKVGRQAVSGTLTNFTSGTKTVALVAAAEWFARVDGAGAGSIQAASTAELATKTAADGPAVLTEPGRDGMFVFDAGNLSALVAADTAQGLYVAPASDPTGASGAWVRKFSGAVNVQWFGVLPGNAAATNVANLNALLAVIDALGVSGGYGLGGHELFFPPDPDFYDFNATIDLRAGIRLRSTGTKFSPGAKLRWTATVTGLRSQSYNTTGATGNGVVMDSAAGVTLDGLWLVGNYDGVMAETEAHGFHARSQFEIRDCMIQYWAGDGIYSGADVANAQGNANCSKFSNVWVETVRNGFYCQGGDVNVIEVNGLSVVGARQYGVFDLSFLGNTYTNLHIATCGREPGTASRPTGLVQYSGGVYQLIPGQEAWAAANAPSGTTADNQGWLYIDFANTGSLPVWNGSLTLRTNSSGGFYIGGANQSSVLVNPYVESDSGFAFVGPLTMVHNGSSSIRSTDGSRLCPKLKATFGQLQADGRFHATSDITSEGDLYGHSQRFYLSNGLFSGSVIDVHPSDGNLRYYARQSTGHSFQIINGPEVAYFYDGGLQLRAGAYMIGSTQVVGAQGAAVADATDAASAVTQLNALLSRLRAHGLIAV